MVSRTGYTVQVDTAARRYLFSDSGTSPRCFGAAGRIKRDIAESGKVPEGADPREILYHRVPVEGALPREAVCVDIKAAYATTLRNMGLIPPDTLSHVMALPKGDRLKAVGMLATRKNVQVWEDARLTNITQQDSPTRGHFFDVCKYVGKVMQGLSVELGEPFLFFWVDGVFMRADPAKVAFATEYLADHGYRVSSEPVTGLKRSDGGKYILYAKGGKRTYLCVPKRIEYSDADLYKAVAECR